MIPAKWVLMGFLAVTAATLLWSLAERHVRRAFRRRRRANPRP